MFTKLISHKCKALLFVLVFGVMLLGVGVAAPQAQAQSPSVAELQAQVMQLMQVLNDLIAQIARQQSGGMSPEGGFVVESFSDGNQVVTTSGLKVRMTPGVSGELVQIIPAGSAGTIVSMQGDSFSNPTVRDGYTWWRVRYESLGITGWSAQNWLRVVDSSVPDGQLVKCTIESSKERVSKGESFVVNWNTDITNPIFIEDVRTWSETQITNFGSKRFTGDYVGAQRYVVGSSKLGEVCDVEVAVYAANVDYDLDITYPRNGNTFEPGDSFYMTWDQDDLEGERGVVTLEGNNTQRHILQNVDIDDERVRVTIPTSDSLGVVTAGEYELKLWVSYIKDGDPKGVHDAVDIVIKTPMQDEIDRLIEQVEQLNSEDDDPSDEELQAMIDDLIAQVEAAEEYEDEDTDEMSNQELQAMVNELMQQIALQNESTPSGGTPHTSFWDIETGYDQVYVVGAYEGSYPSGVRHSFGYHPQGEVTLTMDAQAGQSPDTMLVLTAYEPVLWKLEGDGTQYLTRVFLSGYYDQEITGLPTGVEVVHMSHQSGDSQYFYAYDENSTNFRNLKNYIKGKSGHEINMYYGVYQLDTVFLGQKG